MEIKPGMMFCGVFVPRKMERYVIDESGTIKPNTDRVIRIISGTDTHITIKNCVLGKPPEIYPLNRDSAKMSLNNPYYWKFVGEVKP